MTGMPAGTPRVSSARCVTVPMISPGSMYGGNLSASMRSGWMASSFQKNSLKRGVGMMREAFPERKKQMYSAQARKWRV